jgi:uncharacterized surface protein with fasciclin (FAS1) repeats
MDVSILSGTRVSVKYLVRISLWVHMPKVKKEKVNMPNIVETAVSAGDFTTLVAAVQAAGLVDTLSGPGPFTVFAPTDAAFAKLPEGTVESLLADIPKLTAILTYHVVAGSVHAADLAGTSSAATVQGTNVTFDTSSGVKVNDATVTQADITTSNGVIHIIDTVLIPAS